MKKLFLIIALMVTLGLASSLFAEPASAYWCGGGFGYCAPVCAPMYCAPMCYPMYGCWAPPCPPPCYPMMKKKGVKKEKKK